ncbi:MAG: MCP four helix bundle domain-containing protein [Phycisphaerales bacterium]|nr:MCP four helix bundle domain-containing protein [Phycisphaerales bacterium]
MFKNMTVGKKIGLGFTLIVVLLCGVAVTGHHSTTTAIRNNDAIGHQLQIVREINTALTDAQDANTALQQYMIQDDAEHLKLVHDEIAKAREHATAARELMTSADNRAKTDDLIARLDAYLKAADEWHDLQVRRDQASAVRAQSAAVVTEKLHTLIAAQAQAIDKQAQSVGETRVTNLDVVQRTLCAEQSIDAFDNAQICAEQYEGAITEAERDALEKNWLTALDSTRTVLTECQTHMKDADSLDAVAKSLAALATYTAEVEDFRAIDREHHDLVDNQLDPATAALRADSRAVRDGVYAYIEDLEKKTDADMSLAATLITSIGIGATILGVLLAALITRGITRALNGVIAVLNEGADNVNEAAGQVSTASQQLAQASSEQASSLEETSAAMEEITAVTRTTADSLQQAKTLSAETRAAAQRGDQTTTQLNQSMSQINDASAQISKIIKVIEEIAFQTNLLALNAAVEAARAGEHGKGFAVVADEVRNLAQRAAQASGEITTLIHDTVAKVKEGSDVAGDVGGALNAIVGNVAAVAELIQGIADATNEQSRGVEQINQAVGEMDQVTQQTAAGAEESASAAEELAAQATSVKGTVDVLSAMVGVSGRNGASPAPRRITWQHKRTKVDIGKSSTTPAPQPTAKPTPKRSPAKPAAPVAPAAPPAAHDHSEFLSMEPDEALQTF